jgi:hypothetical protein
MSIIPDIIFSMDPSFKGLGLTIYAQGELHFVKLACKRKIKTFQDAYFGTFEIIPKLDRLISHFNSLGTKKNKVKEFVFEIPPVGASYAPGLFMLDGHILHTMRLNDFISYGVSCKLCGSVVGISRVNKKLGIPKPNKKKVMPDFINSYLPNLKDMTLGMLDIDADFNPLCYNILDPEKDKLKSHDIAESFIILLTYAYIQGWGQEVFPNFDKFCSKPFSHFNLITVE